MLFSVRLPLMILTVKMFQTLRRSEIWYASAQVGGLRHNRNCVDIAD